MLTNKTTPAPPLGARDAARSGGGPAQLAVSVDHHLTSGDQFRPCFGIPVIHRRPAKECPYEQQLNHTSSSQEIATEHPHRPVDPPRRASPPAAQRKGRQVAATVVPAHGDRPAFAQHDPVVGPDGVVLHDWHHNAQLRTTFPTSRRRSAATAAHSNTTRPRTARTMRIGTTGPRNARKFAPMQPQCTVSAGTLQLHAGFPNGSERPEQPCFWAGRARNGPDRPRYMVAPLCWATAGSATIRKFYWCYRSGRPGSGSWRIVPSNIS